MNRRNRGITDTSYCSLAYSALASFRTGMSGSGTDEPILHGIHPLSDTEHRHTTRIETTQSLS